MDDVASALGLTRRTLQRKLAEEDTSFQKQLNSAHEVLALHYVQHTDFPLRDIAYLLGYREMNSFRRSFSAWTGMSPTQYAARKRIR
ncbi:hypothetical protein B9G54_05175 [Alloscardovia macacae]|uniref:HTH araC/xylS-type domain-containing protein n=1 Tax=Alloscardovia macacae TaxID=1160091 RepID=A0A1Y2SXA9_9BIFI|nr:hypothetical protein B9G54_05175 [Alloscardovia macacae]OTA28821.1 hypothetical protein B9T39_05705 [Alloscardovia macacae]